MALFKDFFCIKYFWMRPPSGLFLILRWYPNIMASDCGHDNRPWKNKYDKIRVSGWRESRDMGHSLFLDEEV